jgi:hypothetical protein
MVVTGRCQTKLNQAPKNPKFRQSSRNLANASARLFFEDFAAFEMMIEGEVVVYGGVDGDELLESHHIPEFGHCSFSSPERRG